MWISVGKSLRAPRPVGEPPDDLTDVLGAGITKRAAGTMCPAEAQPNLEFLGQAPGLNQFLVEVIPLEQYEFPLDRQPGPSRPPGVADVAHQSNCSFEPPANPVFRITFRKRAINGKSQMLRPLSINHGRNGKFPCVVMHVTASGN